MKSPITQIQGDIIRLVQMIYEGSLHAPDFHRKQLQRRAERLMKQYKIRTKNYPKLPLYE